MLNKILFTVTGFALALTLLVSNVNAAEKVTICHLTQSSTNETVWITVSVNALDVHLENGDFLPDPELGCSKGDPVPE